MLYPLPKPEYGTFVQILFDQVNDINAAVADVKSKNIRCLSAEPRIGQYSILQNHISFYLVGGVCYRFTDTFGMHQEYTPELLLYRSSRKACNVLASERLQWGSRRAGAGVRSWFGNRSRS